MNELTKYLLAALVVALCAASCTSTEQEKYACAPDTLVLKDLIPPEHFLLETDTRAIVRPFGGEGEATSAVIMQFDAAAYKMETLLAIEGLGNLVVSSSQGSMVVLPLSEIKAKEGKILLEENTLLPLGWFIGAEHIYVGKTRVGSYLFDSDSTYPLTFKIVKDKGYVYLCGRGSIIKEANEPFRLGFDYKAGGWMCCLTQGNELERQGAAQALGWIGDKRIIPSMIPFLQDSSWQVRRNIAWSLGQIGAPGAAEALSSAVEDENDWVSSVAMEALGKLRVIGIPHLVKYLEEEKGDLRESAIYALGVSDSDEAVPILVKVLDSESAELRSMAAQSLGRIGSPICIEPLIRASEDNVPSVRKGAVEALAQIDDDGVVAPLKRIADSDPNEEIRELATEALKKLKR